MEISRAAMRKLMLLIAFAILLFTGLQHFGQVLAFLRFVGGVASPLLIGGAVVIEEVFQWPGIGSLFVNAVRSQNTPLVMMIGFFSVLLVLISSIMVDIVTAFLDPRIKLG